MGIPPDDTRGSGGIFAKSQRRHLIPASSIELLSKEICAALQSGESGRAAAALAKQLQAIFACRLRRLYYRGQPRVGILDNPKSLG
jgi:hypothetical protein